MDPPENDAVTLPPAIPPPGINPLYTICTLNPRPDPFLCPKNLVPGDDTTRQLAPHDALAQAIAAIDAATDADWRQCWARLRALLK